MLNNKIKLLELFYLTGHSPRAACFRVQEIVENLQVSKFLHACDFVTFQAVTLSRVKANVYTKLSFSAVSGGRVHIICF